MGKLTRMELGVLCGLLAIPLVILVCVAATIIAGVLMITFSGATAKPSLMNQSTSPNGRWTVRVYDHNPGAMAPESISADLVDKAGQHKTREVFNSFDFSDNVLWTKDGNHVLIRWKSNSSVTIGGHEVNVVNGYWSD